MKLAQVRRFAMLFPNITEESQFNYSSFRVRGKIFATVPPCHRATVPPEGGHLHVFVAEEEREIALALEPALVAASPLPSFCQGSLMALMSALLPSPSVFTNETW